MFNSLLIFLRVLLPEALDSRVPNNPHWWNVLYTYAIELLDKLEKNYGPNAYPYEDWLLGGKEYGWEEGDGEPKDFVKYSVDGHSLTKESDIIERIGSEHLHDLDCIKGSLLEKQGWILYEASCAIHDTTLYANVYHQESTPELLERNEKKYSRF